MCTASIIIIVNHYLIPLNTHFLAIAIVVLRGVGWSVEDVEDTVTREI